MAKAHVFDQVADELAQWIDDTATALAEGLTAGGRAPFAADLTERELLDYYDAQFFRPDGSVNDQGRADVMQRVGETGYADVFRRVMRRRMGPAMPAPPVQGEPMPPTPAMQGGPA
ncbi:MAG: hypothetical protein NUW22_13765 [Acidobacteria bacterium]|nr:hypothetical protein [Acidobacteriota bacterium]